MVKVFCFYANQNKKPRGVAGLSRLTKKEAQKICSDPESSSQTAKSKTARRRTKKYGDWFFGYREM